MQGFIRFLISNHPMALYLRENIVFKIVPMINVDGVYHGHYRMSIHNENLNRFYEDPRKDRHPEIFAIKRIL